MSRALLWLLGAVLVIQIRGDGYFPFSKSWPETHLLLIVLPHTLALVACVAVVAAHLARLRDDRAVVCSVSPPLVVGAILPALGILGIAAMHALQAWKFADVGYRLNPALLAIFVAASAAPLACVWARRRTPRPAEVLTAILVSALVFKLLPLVAFPVTAKRSDLLPILEAAGRSLLGGENVYQYYLLDNGVRTQNVRLPGLILAYLPASGAGIDLRWMTLAYEATIFLVLISRVVSWESAIALAALLVFPYWHYRHELYEPPFWLMTLGAFMGLERGNPRVLGACAGAMIASHHWGALFALYLAIAAFRARGARFAISAGGTAVAVAVLLLAVVIGRDWLDFRHHVIEHYHGTGSYPYHVMSMYFTPWLAKLGLARALLPIQALVQVPLLVLAWRRAVRLDGLAAVMAASLTALLLFNPVAWTYQYLLVLFLLALGLHFRSTPESTKRSVPAIPNANAQTDSTPKGYEAPVGESEGH